MNRNSQRAFIADIAPAAQATQRKWGVPASVTIAQAILESGWGQSALARAANNFFGIKNTSWKGPYMTFPTKEFVGMKEQAQRADFRFYKTAEESFENHGCLLATLDRYRPAMADRENPVAFAQRLQDCGYSTDPEYARKLVDLITDRDFDLKQYDKEIASPAKTAEA